MPKFYIGGANLARTGKKLYLGDGNNLARKVKKVYVGDSNGVAQVGWKSAQGVIYLRTNAIAQARRSLAGATSETFAMFGGGYGPSNYSSVIDAFDSSLINHHASATLSTARTELAAATVGNLVLFGGGKQTNSVATVDAFDPSFTRTSSKLYNNSGRYALAGVSIGNYALFWGGRQQSSNHPYSSTVDYYNSSLTTSQIVAGYERGNLAGASTSNYAIVGGGNNTYGTPDKQVEAVRSSLTRTVCTSLTNARAYLSATSVNNNVLFSGGHNNSTVSPYTYPTSTEVYNNSLTKSIINTGVARGDYAAGTTVKNYALFGGGENPARPTSVDVYDASLVYSQATPLSKGRGYLAAASVNNYAIFAGGVDSSSTISAADIYEVV